MQLLTRLDRYIGYEILRVFSVILLVLVLILIGGILVKMLKLAATGAVPPDSVFTLLSIEVLRLSGRLIPAAFFFATVMTLGRMYQDQEMTALLSSGIGPARLFRIILLLCIPLALISSWLVLSIYPAAGRVNDQIRSQHQDAILLSAIEAGRFYEARGGKLVFYAKASDMDTGELGNVFIHQREQKNDVTITVAKSGLHKVDEESGMRDVILYNGYQYSATPGMAEATIVDFDTYTITINPREQSEGQAKLKTVGTLDLLQDESHLARAELETRLIFPLSVIAFGMLAVPLSRSNVRQSAYLRVMFAVIAYLVFTSLSKTAETWMLKGVTPFWAGTWWVVLLMLVVTLVIVLTEQYRFKWRRRRAKT